MKIVLFTLLLASASTFEAFGAEADLSGHWKRPVDASYGGPADDLYPESCAQCHKAQYDDWKAALHSKSVGPGLTAQLDAKADPQTAVSCYYCHAPLALQSEVIEKNGAGETTYAANTGFDTRLQSSGVSCAACHVRKGGVFGPNGRSGQKDASNGHASNQADFFEKAEFCAACHQLDEGYALNGKPLVNTYNEWKESDYGKNNITCQNCHMPGKRHLFRGIHDLQMVKSGVTFEVKKSASKSGVIVNLRITNSGTGHYFPTYATPRVVVKGFLTDANGKTLANTLKEGSIGRKVALDLSEETSDTRIPPMGSYEFDYRIKRPVKARELVIEVHVLPDEFYNGFFASALRTLGSTMSTLKLKEAYKNTSDSGYLLFREEIPLDPA
ncbi:MAG: multiheme c-type cytochrome [Deltaproteobacteria bacterium]